MSSPNINMRDPVMYRILHATHHHTGDEWCIYPMYDWAHGQSDSIEGITHSLCDIDYEQHRPLYNWFLDQLGIYHPRQIEFARLHITYTVLSKRYLRRMVEEGHVRGWDDPRMPTLSAMRRRGYPPEAIRAFCDGIGIAKSNSIVDIELLEYYVRQDLNKRSPRVMGVLDPLKVVIDGDKYYVGSSARSLSKIVKMARKVAPGQGPAVVVVRKGSSKARAEHRISKKLRAHKIDFVMQDES